MCIRDRAYAVLVVSLTRIIAGYHYLGDILVGGLIGIIIGIIATPVFARLARALWNRIAIGDSVLARRDIGYAFLFLMTFQFATMFNGARLIAGEFVGFVTGG